jgi:hypothetical protein
LSRFAFSRDAAGWVVLSVALGAVVATVGGCNANPGSTSPTVAYFPVLKEHQQQLPLFSTVEGELTLEGGCVHLKPVRGEDTVPIWPVDFSFMVEDREIRIVDDAGQVVATVGDMIKVGGGEVRDRGIVEKLTGDLPPETCKGPFWLVSRVVED